MALSALLSLVGALAVVPIWAVSLHVPFQYTHTQADDEQDATLDLMLIKDIKETGWFSRNPHLGAPTEQRWAEWPMGGDLLAYVIKKAMVSATGDVVLTFNLFWLLTFPLAALCAFPVLRSLRCRWGSSVVGATLFALTPYHIRNGAGHENLAFVVGIPVIVLCCMRILGGAGGLPALGELRHRGGWRRLRWLLAGCVLVGVTGIYYLAFLITLLAICSIVAALAYRNARRLVLAGIFAATGLIASVLANLPTLAFRAAHATNLLGVPDRASAVSEAYPLRLVELLSPVTAHRFAPFAAIADRLYEPGRAGLGTAELGLFAASGFVVALVALLMRAVRGSARESWRSEARIGLLVAGALLLGTKGGLSRALEYVGLQGVRAWSRLAIVVAFAAIVVSCRLLDRLRVAVLRRGRAGGSRLASRSTWAALLAVVIVLGVLDQASPRLVPDAAAATRARLWNSDAAFVRALEQQLPPGAMVFQLPVVDFPEHDYASGMLSHDLIKETYLHSRTLRWSTAAVRGRDGEWQFPAAQLPTHDLLRGLDAMGFRAVMIDRAGFDDGGVALIAQLDQLLGAPIATARGRLMAWDLRPADALLAGLDAAGRRRIVTAMLDEPHAYLRSDARPVVGRGEPTPVCATATVILQNPGPATVTRTLRVSFSVHPRAYDARLHIGRRAVSLPTDGSAATVAVPVPSGVSHLDITVDTFGRRCASTPTQLLTQVAIALVPGELGP
jgi:hypothetical protein